MILLLALDVDIASKYFENVDIRLTLSPLP